MVQAFPQRSAPDAHLSRLLREYAHPYTGELHELDPLMDLIGDASLVLIGEASHGTHEYYKARIDLTRRLIEERGFNVVAVEADWPDAWMVNRYVKLPGTAGDANEALGGFERFPTWMWRNADVLSFVEWLYRHNQNIADYDRKVGFYGLDLYSLHRSVDAIINYLQQVDPQSVERARQHYDCLSAYGVDEQAYGYAAALGLARDCEAKIITELVELRERESQYLSKDGSVASDEYFFASQNAKIVATAQAYYKEMFRGRVNTWNLRDRHMTDTLLSLRRHMQKHGQELKAVIWAHNSHLGDARATQMHQRGEFNLGQLLRERFGRDCCSIGFSGYSGTVTAASRWGGPAERKNVRPGMLGSYEALFHNVDLPAFLLPLKAPNLVAGLRHARLQRAIGVIYLPDTERVSHYFFAHLPDQFDAIVHFQETQAVEPLERTALWISGEDRVAETID